MKIIESGLKFNGKLDKRERTSLIVIHHAEATECTIEDIQRWHLDYRWSGCGYHYFIRKDGRIYTGRSEDTIGAHCRGNNIQSIGICLEGNFNKENIKKKQINALVRLCKTIMTKYNIEEIRGHRELFQTDCPGNKFPLEDIKRSIREKNDNKSIDILDLQKYLNRNGILDYENKRLIEDGILGKRTQSAFEKLCKDILRRE